ncbi:MAG: hypothetical protein ACJAXZ_001878 [Akkermansiaceae bacterium]|jgi:hypothetical protein
MKRHSLGKWVRQNGHNLLWQTNYRTLFCDREGKNALLVIFLRAAFPRGCRDGRIWDSLYVVKPMENKSKLDDTSPPLKFVLDFEVR